MAKVTNAQKLKTVVEYAVENGWKEGKSFVSAFEFWGKEIVYHFLYAQKERFIFSHPFAKAVYGVTHEWKKELGGLRCKKCQAFALNRRFRKEVDKNECPGWQYGLKEQVLANDPLDYLYQFVKERLKIEERR